MQDANIPQPGVPSPIDITKLLQQADDDTSKKLRETYQAKLAKAVGKIVNFMYEEGMTLTDWFNIKKTVDTATNQLVGSIPLRDLHKHDNATTKTNTPETNGGGEGKDASGKRESNSGSKA